MKKRNDVKKLRLSKETLGVLDPKRLEGLGGAAAITIGPTTCPRESVFVCSVMHTCVSCQTETETGTGTVA